MLERKFEQELLHLMEQRIQTPRTSRGFLFSRIRRAEQGGALLLQSFTKPLAIRLKSGR